MNTQKQILEDDARKFITPTIDPSFLAEHNAVSFILAVDWLETGEDNEKKIAYKTFENGDTQILLITKVTKNGHRTSEKEPISEDAYKQFLASSILHLEKRRYEFEYTQQGSVFAMKYDEFTESGLRILEVDAPTKEERDAFDPHNFPSDLDEVTGDIRYYGYRVADIV